ncbi:hypothetical protein EVJ50_12765 [Synechococcus sp. RSCCF101]|uniref:hypothetical protein n=1 Tax=Synechococcus sp. RSCCF101 TaxID=2511069 RepID=UPI0012441A20|nr:hypothetical protein [Synechococcus sp. RSCCF101]QEY32969.1 hypothetical protein EVJ50_12765 [Synechococcus sp. RSCCF101]
MAALLQQVSRVRVSGRLAAALLGGSLLTGGWLADGLVPAVRAGQEPPRFPTPAQWRELQLQALACSRENSDAPCLETRRTADDHLDNILLTSSCKDVLWELTQVATVQANNSFQRRDRIDAAAARLPLVCRQPDKRRQQPPRRPSGPAQPGALNPAAG